MTDTFSSWAKEFIQGSRLASITSLDKAGNPHVTTIWYLLEEDGTIMLTSSSHSQKYKNLRRDSRIALCVGDAGISIGLYGHVTFSEEPIRVRHDIERLVDHYIQDVHARSSMVERILQRDPVSLRFVPEKITEFTVLSHRV